MENSGIFRPITLFKPINWTVGSGILIWVHEDVIFIYKNNTLTNTLIVSYLSVVATLQGIHLTLFLIDPSVYPAKFSLSVQYKWVVHVV